MFLTKFLQSSRAPKGEPPVLVQNAWKSIVQYYETTQDPLNDLMASTCIPTKLQRMATLLCEEIDTSGPNACFQYIVENRILEELAEFAKADTPYGMRTHCLRFFSTFIINVPASELHTRSICIPLQKLIQSTHRVIAHHYNQLADSKTDTGESSVERRNAIAEVSLELVGLLRSVISRLRDSKAMMDILFERGWCSGLGEKVWKEKSTEDNRIQRRNLTAPDKLAWNVFIQPRFTMFSMLLDFINTPGETSEIAREAVLFALRMVDNDPEYLCYIVEYSGFAETLADRLAMMFATTLDDSSAFKWTPNTKLSFRYPPKYPVQSCTPLVFNDVSIYPSLNAPCSGKRRKRQYSTFDIHFWKLLTSQQNQEAITDEFFALWEYLNDVMRRSSPILSASIGFHLYTHFWQPVLTSTLCSSKQEITHITTVRITEMVRSLKDRSLQHLFMLFLLGEHGGDTLDLLPESTPSTIAVIGNEGNGDIDLSSHSSNLRITLRQVLINRITDSDESLSVVTIRLFDTIIETHNQFVICNLLLRNYSDGKTNENDSGDDDQTTEDSCELPPVDIKQKAEWLVGRFLSLLPCEKQIERRSSCSSLNQQSIRQERSSIDLRRNTLASPIPSASSKANSTLQRSIDTQSVSSTSSLTTLVDEEDDYFLEAMERWNMSQLSYTFWKDNHVIFDSFKQSCNQKSPSSCGYEGSFLAALFDATSKICETGVAKSLMLTRLLGKVAVIADERADWIVCCWQNIPSGNDDLSYNEYDSSIFEQKPESRTIHGVLERVTLEALKRARTIPKFETKLRVTKEKGKHELLQVGTSSAEPVKQESNIYKQITRRTSFTQLLFNSVASPPVSPTPSESTAPSSPTAAFFQYPPPRANWTPITLTNPFAKLPEFLTGYIILQEFCKEMAATVMVKYVDASEPDILCESDNFGPLKCVHPLDESQ
ncbi:hypothetical protein K450DRAFT_224325 [Umbelopsis ramanniana AG]|uniref:Uncharacterized protein n=1 Tax=Umbelopsis ramanniana AG TaxID=1314678 RepID=A0AAD5EHQ0_UMBRA|nr:uncharacterized protein K450DRAFT_224325 [Umbelopsis ramanniana AG]KAI8583121.1 hypothetical protein K450DRAFT_224325 [Umbelopsis ramanniana AG]